jgi:DNA-binding response OmpR family regulator
MAEGVQNPKVLIVDDEPNIRELVQVALNFHGFEVCRRLRAGANDVPVIFLTARDATSDAAARARCASPTWSLTRTTGRLGGPEPRSVLETYVSYLRRKLDPLGPPLIHTRRGVGYSLHLP